MKKFYHQNKRPPHGGRLLTTELTPLFLLWFLLELARLELELQFLLVQPEWLFLGRRRLPT